MVPGTLVGWLLRLPWRQAATWLALGACAVGVHAFAVLSWSHDPSWLEAALSTWLLPVGLVGAACSLRALQSNCAFLERLVPAVRLRAEVLALVGGALGFQLPLTLLLAVLLPGGGTPAGPAEPGAWVGILVGDLHLALLGVWVLVLGLRPVAATLFYGLAVWTAAALLAGGRGHWFVPLLDPWSHPARFASFAEAPGAALAGSAPLLALWLAARLWRRPSVPAPRTRP